MTPPRRGSKSPGKSIALRLLVGADDPLAATSELRVTLAAAETVEGLERG
jgi:hypothetical protein